MVLSPEPADRDPVHIRIGRKVAQRRVELLLAQGDIARHLGIPVSEVEDVEAGERAFTASQLYDLSILLRVTPGWFFET